MYHLHRTKLYFVMSNGSWVIIALSLFQSVYVIYFISGCADGIAVTSEMIVKRNNSNWFGKIGFRSIGCTELHFRNFIGYNRPDQLSVLDGQVQVA